MQSFPADDLRRLLTEIFLSWGMSVDHAVTAAARMIESDLRGIDSHGIAMLSTYEKLRDGGQLNVKPEIRIVTETPGTALIDAGASIGHIPATQAMELAIEKCRAIGIGAVDAEFEQIATTDPASPAARASWSPLIMSTVPK